MTASAATNLRGMAAAGVRWTSVSAVVATVAQLTQLVVLGRLLDPQAFGLMAMVLLILGLLQSYADLGLSSALVYRVDATREQLASLYWLNVATGVVTFGVLVAATPLLVRAFDEPAVVPLLRVAGLVLLVAGATRQFEVLLQRDLAFRSLALQDIAAATLGTAVAVLLAAGGAGAWALVGGALATAGVRGAALLFVGLRRYRPALHWRLADTHSFLGFGMFQVGERTVNYVSQRVDQFLVGSLVGTAALGLYGFAFNVVSQPVSRINPIVTKVAFPTLARVAGDRERLRRAFIDMCHLLTTVNAPLLLGFVAVAPALVPGVFGAKWEPAVPVAQLLAVVALSRSIANPVGSLLLALGRADLGFRWNVLVFVVSVPTTVVGGMRGGLLGVAYALAALQLGLQVLNYWLLVRPLIGSCAAAYAAAVLRPLAHGAVMALIVVAVGVALPPLPPLAVAAVQVAVGAAVYGGTLLLVERPLLRTIHGLIVARQPAT